MELAKVTTKGQITIPKSIRDMLNIKDGSKIIFIQRGNDIIIKNSAMIALEKIQDAFDGEAERLGLEDEEDVAEMIKEFTNEKLVYSVDEKNIECEIQSYVEVKKDCFAVDCNIIVNGKLNPDFDVYKEYKDLGEITFLDNDNDGDFEFIIVNTEE